MGRRWLLPLVAPLFALVAVLGQAVTAWAAAGPTGAPACCCPAPTACKCHDHDDRGDQPAQLKRCGGDAKLVAPSVLASVAPAPVALAVVPRVAAVAPPALPAPIESPPREPETPPF